MDSILHDSTDTDVGPASREYRRIELITGTVRRRHWSAEEKASLVAESFRAGHQHIGSRAASGVNRGLLQTWRRHATQEAEQRRRPRSYRFASRSRFPARRENGEPAVLAPDVRKARLPGQQDKGTIEIEAGDMHVRVHGSVDLEALRTVLAKLERQR